MADEIKTETLLGSVDTAPVKTENDGTKADAKPDEKKPDAVDAMKAPETKPDAKPEEKKGDAKPDEKKPEEKKEDEKKVVVPDKYEFKAPDGVAIDTAALEKASPVFKELGLSQESAQKLMDLQFQMIKEQNDAYQKQVTDWQTEIKKDPKYKETLASAKRAVNVLADAETAKLITDSWMGNHPGIVKFLSKVGSLVKDDNLDEGSGSAAGGPKTLESVLFADMFNK